jgi:hypothetical protein
MRAKKERLFVVLVFLMTTVLFQNCGEQNISTSIQASMKAATGCSFSTVLIPLNNSVRAYSNPSSGQCTSEIRTCTQSGLSGSLPNISCLSTGTTASPTPTPASSPTPTPTPAPTPTPGPSPSPTPTSSILPPSGCVLSPGTMSSIDAGTNFNLVFSKTGGGDVTNLRLNYQTVHTLGSSVAAISTTVAPTINTTYWYTASNTGGSCATNRLAVMVNLSGTVSVSGLPPATPDGKIFIPNESKINFTILPVGGSGTYNYNWMNSSCNSSSSTCAMRINKNNSSIQEATNIAMQINDSTGAAYSPAGWVFYQQPIYDDFTSLFNGGSISLATSALSPSLTIDNIAPIDCSTNQPLNCWDKSQTPVVLKVKSTSTIAYNMAPQGGITGTSSSTISGGFVCGSGYCSFNWIAGQSGCDGEINVIPNSGSNTITQCQVMYPAGTNKIIKMYYSNADMSSLAGSQSRTTFVIQSN